MAKETIELKIHCGTPMISTLMFSGAEFYCIRCGKTQGIFGSAGILPWTAKLGEEAKLNKGIFNQIAAACIPVGCRFPKCKKCDGQDHLLHASNEALNKSSEAYKLLAGGIEEEILNSILDGDSNATN